MTVSRSQIITYPKSRSENCRAKSQATKGWFKPMVCMLKNTWSRFVESNAIAADVTPSYRIEGMLYNVPDDKFGVNYAETFAKICTGSASKWTGKAHARSYRAWHASCMRDRNQQPVRM
jgi:hypothetical protein